MNNICCLIPNYNNAAYIKQCLDSVINQPLDILVVDDGSTDDSRDIINSYNVNSIFQSNRGPAAARNAGMECIMKRGYEFIILLDSDDYLYDNFLQDTLPVMRNKSVVAVYGDYDILVNQEGIEPFLVREYKRSLDNSSLWRECLMPHQALIRTTAVEMVLNKYGTLYDNDLRVCNDYDFDLKLNQFGILWHTPRLLGVVREGINNSCSNIKGKIRHDCMSKLRNTNKAYYL